MAVRIATHPRRQARRERAADRVLRSRPEREIVLRRREAEGHQISSTEWDRVLKGALTD